jgi:hypothetical protein
MPMTQNSRHQAYPRRLFRCTLVFRVDMSGGGILDFLLFGYDARSGDRGMAYITV